MGKNIISQARGRGGPRYRVNRFAYRYRIGYAQKVSGVAKILRLINSSAHGSPLAKILINKEIFFIPAAQGLIEGQDIKMCMGSNENGSIEILKNLPITTRVFNIEIRPNDGGKLIRTSGGYATIMKKEEGYVILSINNKREIRLNENCRATVGIISAQGRTTKPIVKAGKHHHMMRTRGKMWHTTSPVKMNAVDHPFGGGRGKRIKSKIAKRNAPAGKKVGHILPRRTGVRK